MPESDPRAPVPARAQLPPVPMPDRAVVVCGSVGAADPRLADEVRALLRTGSAAVVTLDVEALSSVDLGTVEALARLQLLARGLGARMRLRGPSPELTALLDLAGLAEVVPGDRG